MAHIFPFSWQLAWLVVASLLAGALNAMAGGGSFLSFPAILRVGVPPIPANATNTVALWPGLFSSVAAYRKEMKQHTRLLIPVVTASLLGGLGGAILLLRTGSSTFLHLVPWLLLFASVLFVLSGPMGRWLGRRASREAGKTEIAPGLGLFLGMTLVCCYVGYFGAGGGFLVMSLLGILGMKNIHEMNALKVASGAASTGIAVFTFLIKGLVVWHYGLLMMFSGAIGGYLGGHFSRKLNPGLMRWIVALVGFGTAGYFFWKVYA